MRVEQLRLIAFGPFTDTLLDFSNGRQGLHLVFGPNEAGKSSALRALIQMLFGIPLRTSDNFLHAHANLRIGGRLRRADGTVLEFVRRKGQSKTLRAADDHTPLDDDAVSAVLGGLDQASFSRLFAIGHAELVQGGTEIVAGGGDAGQALFVAGSGLMRLRTVQERLLRECDELFKPGGSVPAINRGLAELRDTRRLQKEAVLPAKTWQAHDQALRDARQRLTQVQNELAAVNQAKNRLTRIGAAVAHVARRSELTHELTGYRDVPVLPEGFGDRRREVEAQLMIAENQGAQAREIIAKAGARVEALGLPDRVLAHAQAVELLQRELGSHLKAAKDRPQLAARMRSLHQEAESRLSDTGRAFRDDPAAQPKLSQTLIEQIQRLGKSHARWTTQLESLGDDRRRLTLRRASLSRQHLDIQSRLIAPAALSELKDTLEEAMGAGQFQERLSEEQAAIQLLRQAAADALRRQRLWSGSPDELEVLPLPAMETIDLFEEQDAELTHRMSQLQRERASSQKELARAQADLTALDLTQEVPTEEDLNAARRLRDEGWALVRAELADGGGDAGSFAGFTTQFSTETTLVAAFEQSLRQADAISDRLRREADRVHRKALLLAEQMRFRMALADLERQIAGTEADRQDWQSRWLAQWAPCAVAPLMPRQMRAWIGEMHAVRDKFSDVHARSTRAEVHVQALGVLRDRLAAALSQCGVVPSSDDTFSDLLRAAKTRVVEQERLHVQAGALDKELMARTLELEEIETRISAIGQQAEVWKAQWGQAVTRVGLGVDVDPAEAVGVVEALRAARARIDEAEVLRQRIEGIDRDASAFEAQVDALARAVAAEPTVEPAHIRAAALNARLTAARQAEAERNTLADQLGKARTALNRAEEFLAAGQTALALLCRQAECTDVAFLPDVEQRARVRDRLAAELSEVEKHLLTLSGGAAVENFAQEVAAVNPDSLEGALNELNLRIESLEAERSRLDQAIGTEHSELRRMDGSARAAELAEQAEHLLARMEADVARYARIRIAAAILAGAIESYREKNQGPLIERAGMLFTRMTLGSFYGVRAEYDDQGHPVLVGLRPDGAQVHVQGMSDGSADQLYLALRLAALEAYFRTSEPLPFIVDDILLRFDDRRAAATLEVLAELSARTQVIFFTHHRHLLELAQASPSVAAVVYPHYLGEERTEAGPPE